jgi:hypothetical protein
LLVDGTEYNDVAPQITNQQKSLCHLSFTLKYMPTIPSAPSGSIQACLVDNSRNGKAQCRIGSLRQVPKANGHCGGMVSRPCAAPGEGQEANAFVRTVGMQDLNASPSKLTALGGKVALPKMPIPGVGLVA